MGDEELTGYITRSREKGRTKEQIIRALYSVGWKKEKVETAFQKLDENKNWQKEGAIAAQPQLPQGKKNEPNTATQQQIQMLQQSRQQHQTQPEAAPQQAAQLTPATPIQLPQKKPLFSLPSLFGKKPAQTQQVQQAAAPAPAAQTAPQQTTPGPVQQQPAASPPQTHPAPQPAASQQYTPGIMPPATTFTIGTQQVTFGSATATHGKPPAGNPAFSNLASAAAGMTDKRNLLPILLVIAVLLLAAGLFISLSHAPVPIVNGPRINLTNEQDKKINITKPPVLQNTTKKPAIPPANASKTNVAKPTPAQKNSTTLPPIQNFTQKSTAPSGGQSSNPRFSRYSQFNSSESSPPSKFCQGNNAALYRVHYLEYTGPGCLNDRRNQSYAFPIDFPYACDAIPCCYNAASYEYSRLYDSFECGYYES